VAAVHFITTDSPGPKAREAWLESASGAVACESTTSSSILYIYDEPLSGAAGGGGDITVTKTVDASHGRQFFLFKAEKLEDGAPLAGGAQWRSLELALGAKTGSCTFGGLQLGYSYRITEVGATLRYGSGGAGTATAAAAGFGIYITYDDSQPVIELTEETSKAGFTVAFESQTACGRYLGDTAMGQNAFAALEAGMPTHAALETATVRFVQVSVAVDGVSSFKEIFRDKDDDGNAFLYPYKAAYVIKGDYVQSGFGDARFYSDSGGNKKRSDDGELLKKAGSLTATRSSDPDLFDELLEDYNSVEDDAAFKYNTDEITEDCIIYCITGGAD
jgi:hypothetical protein